MTTTPTMVSKRKPEGPPEVPSRNLGAPRVPTKPGRYVTGGGLTIESCVEPLNDSRFELDRLVTRLDTERGCLFESSYEFPGRCACARAPSRPAIHCALAAGAPAAFGWAWTSSFCPQQWRRAHSPAPSQVRALDHGLRQPAALH